MAFVTQYNADRRPRQVGQDGREEFVAGRLRWDIYNEWERIRERRELEDAGAVAITTKEAILSDADGSVKAKTTAIPRPTVKTPQKVVDMLAAARGELEYITETITMVEQRQFLSLVHVPYSPEPSVTAREAAFALQRRHARVKEAAERLRKGADTLTEQARVEAKFLDDLAELRKRWRLGRHSSAHGGQFYVDVAMRLPGHENDHRTHCTKAAEEEARVNVVPNGTGAACIVLPASECGDHHPSGRLRVVQGPAAIDEALHERFMQHCWRQIVDMLTHELIAGDEEWDSDGAVHAVLRMAHVAMNRWQRGGGATPSGERTKDGASYGSSQDRQDAVSVQRGAAAKDVQAFCALSTSQAGFEARALRRFADVSEAAGVPDAVVQVLGGHRERETLLPFLVGWLRHFALCHAVQRGLDVQVTDASDCSSVALPRLSSDALRASWQVGVEGRAVGMLVVEGNTLMWHGCQLKGIALDAYGRLGRRSLDRFLECVSCS